MLKRWVSLAILLFAAGCNPNDRSFNISLKNDTSTYLTLNLAKDAPQHELLWASPEDIDEERVMITGMPPGIVAVPPGKTASKQGIVGRFEGNVQAVLRVYRGKDLSQRDLLATKPGVDRQDVVLKPGDNQLIVRDYHGALTVEPVK